VIFSIVRTKVQEIQPTRSLRQFRHLCIAVVFAWFAARTSGAFAQTEKNTPAKQAHPSEDTPKPSAKSDENSAGRNEDRSEPSPPEGVDMTKVKRIAHEELHPNGKKKSLAEGYYTADGKFIKHGKYQEWNEAGQVILESHFVHDVQHGERKTWYPSGQLQSEVNYINGKEDGTYTKYFPDGKPASVWHMKLGAWDGMYTDYHRTGQKKIEVEFVYGLRQGPQSQWDEDGVLTQKSDYTDGVEQP